LMNSAGPGIAGGLPSALLQTAVYEAAVALAPAGLGGDALDIASRNRIGRERGVEVAAQ